MTSTRRNVRRVPGSQEPASPASSRETERLGIYQARVDARLSEWEATSAPSRIWDREPSFWPAADPSSVKSRLGWLSLPEAAAERLHEIREFGESVRDQGTEHLLLLGMGGSSLAPETLARIFGASRSGPDLRVLDSTHPEAVRTALADREVARTLFIVSSKSGTTLEPNAFCQYFWSKVARQNRTPGEQFVAITDPGTPLEQHAREHAFRHCFLSPPDVGGRYSALSPFGLVPAGLLGLDVERLVASSRRMSERCGPNQPAVSNPGLRLGAMLGELARAGRDKVILVPSPSLGAFPPWLEQLLAESLGKRGKGLVPVAGEADPENPMGAHDRFLVELRGPGEARTSDSNPSEDPTPRVVFALENRDEIGGEFFRWEFAVAAAGAILGVDPFDQPDVELAKELAREAMRRTPGPRGAGSPVPVISVGRRDRLAAELKEWRARARSGDYVAVQAFLNPDPAVRAGVGELTRTLRATLRLATTSGFGPRYLHSTGQLHKGGPPSGLFLQLIDEPSTDLEVPGMSLSFAQIIHAQADGDAAALRHAGRRLLRVELGRDAVAGLGILCETFAA